MSPGGPRSPRRALTVGFGRPEKDSAVSTHSSLPQPSVPAPGPRPQRGGLRLVPGSTLPEQLPLALEWEVSPGVPAEPPVPADLRVVGQTPADDLPDPGRWVAQLARAIAEVSVGERPPAQLTRWVSRGELAKLSLRASYVARHPAARAQRGVARQRTVRSVRVCPVAPGIVETSAVLVGTDRAKAIAIRLEAVSGRWLATAIEMR